MKAKKLPEADSNGQLYFPFTVQEKQRSDMDESQRRFRDNPRDLKHSVPILLCVASALD